MSLTWAGWQRGAGQFDKKIGSLIGNSLCAITLTTGQIYYGTLAEAKDGYLRISGVYYVQNATQPNGGALQFHLLSQQKTDWNAPDWMAIPLDKVLFVENVGTSSRVAKLIEQDQAAIPSLNATKQ